MDYIAIDTNSFRYLEHYGVKGQKWGIRRYQNEDGTLKPGAKDRYNDGKITRELNRNERQMAFNKTRRANHEENRNLARKLHMKRIEKIFDDDIKKTDKRIKDGEERAKLLMRIAKEKNYSIKSNDVTRYTNAGMVAIAAFNPAAIPYAAISLGSDIYSHRKYGGDHGGFVKGKRYRSER